MKRAEISSVSSKDIRTPWHKANAQQKCLNPTLRALASLAALVLTVADLSLNAHMCWNQLYVNYPQETHDTYVSAVNAQMEELGELDADAFYRVDKTYNRAGAAFNEGISHGFNQLSTYPSANNPKAVAFLNALGYSSEGEFSSVYAASNLVMDSLLGVRYMGSWTQPAASNATGIAGSTIVSPIYVNPYALSLGLPCNSDRIAIRLPEGSNPFERQNDLFAQITGIDEPTLYRLADRSINVRRDPNHMEC